MKIKNRYFLLFGAVAAPLFMLEAAQVVADPHPGIALYPAIRNKVAPADGGEATLNPPNFLWPREANQTIYELELSQDADFTNYVIRSGEQRACFFNPHRKLDAGTWYWRYQSRIGQKIQKSPIYSFVITDSTPVFVTPPIQEVVKNLPAQRPYMLTYGQSQEKILSTAKKYPHLVEKLRKEGDIACKNMEIIDLDKLDALRKANKLHLTDFLRQYNAQVMLLPQLTRAYLVTGDPRYAEAAEKRIRQHLATNFNDLMLQADRSRSLAEAYDTFYNNLSAELRKEMLDYIQKFLEKQYAWWPGNREAIFLENHFWQTQISGFFFAALATVAERPENIKYLDYAYGIFLARVPVAGGNGGGWANGLPYFTVNYSTVADMAYYLHAIGKVNIFDMPWYRNLPGYLLYCGRPYAPMDGFGNMHDRAYQHYKHTKIGWNFGQRLVHYIALASGNQEAVTYAALVPYSNPLLELATGKPFDFQIPENLNLPKSRLFQEVGITAMHTTLMAPKTDMAVYFRSSPFGAHGHMHANQNSFNIAARGERIFYSSGYYTDFNDPHATSSYRHTQAHNSILVDGKGQAYGPEGYGWIKRYAHGDQISYVCGNAANAYVAVTTPNWKKDIDKYLTPKVAEKLFGDSKLRKFDRHLIFLRPKTVLIYDDLDSEVPHDWTFLLHTYLEPKLTAGNVLTYNHDGIKAEARLFSPVPLSGKLTDKFYIDHRDKSPRYKNAPDQYHASWQTAGKTPKQRFFAVIQCTDSDRPFAEVRQTGKDTFRIGEYQVRVNLDPAQKAMMTVTGPDAAVFVNSSPEQYFGVKCGGQGDGTLIMEKQNGKVIQSFSTDMLPVIQQ